MLPEIVRIQVVDPGQEAIELAKANKYQKG
jgi:hypothetical protein